MIKKMKFIWIDDDPDSRKQESINMQKRLKVEMDYKDVKNNSLQSCIEQLIRGNIPPDLILIDHKFDEDRSQIFKTGSSVAAVIRDKWPLCPIICVTGVSINALSSLNKSLYEEVIPYHDISDYDETILSIAKAYIKISETRYKNLNKLFELLQAPETEYGKLKTILPNELKEDFRDKGFATNFSHWIRNTLIGRPGFLYDKLWLSTLLGIKEASFHKVENLFKPALYTGIFKLDSNPRWWKDSALTILSEKVTGMGLSYDKGRQLKYGKTVITKKDYSHCYVDPTEIPETVAFEDDTQSSNRHPMSFKNTIPHPLYSDMLFFDQIRMMKSLE